jgi:hypothetical protein
MIAVLWVIAAGVGLFAVEFGVAWLWMRHEIRRLDQIDDGKDQNESMKGQGR